jgi:cation-transporting ATPase E
MKTKIQGLTEKEVLERIEKNQINHDTTIKTKSIKEIFITNICTLFNFLNLFLGLIIILVGSYKNLLFLGTILCNTVIGIFQEIKSKKTIDKLSLISEKTSTVIRDSEEIIIPTTDIVKDDILVLEIGNQIVTDCTIIENEIEVNESLITGEINPIKKKKGDTLLSGSFVVSGKCIAKVDHVAEENYTYKITKDAKYIKQAKSEIMVSLKKIVKIVSYLIIPIGILFFYKQICIESNNMTNAVVNTVAALIAIIPDGLILLTSTVMAISVIKLSKYKVLIQELYCIENLARVDTICFDKTGTLTKGSMQVKDYIKIKDENIDDIIKEICYNLDNHNATMNALTKKYGKANKLEVKEIIPFSSEKKYSAVTFDKETYILGAPEYVLKKQSNEINELLKKFEDYRILLLAKGKTLEKIEPLGIFIIEDEIRKDAKQTIDFFEENNVEVKIISGDNPKTVSKIAKKIGLSFWDNYIDTTDMTEKELIDVANKYKIFGRVTPQGKKILISSMQNNNHTVAMTGDGVNDVLALRQADCAIAVSEGADAARNVAHLVLLNSDFKSIPKIVLEGRRTINNIERSASLFITKTLYATMLLLLFLFVDRTYPFMPIQLTLTSVFTIGIPAFILALEPNNEKVKKNFLLNVATVAFPTSLTITFNTILLIIAADITGISNQTISTLAVLLLGTTGFMHIYRISKPLNLIRKTLLISMITSFLIAIFGFEKLFSLSIIDNGILAIYLILMLFSYLFFNIITKIFNNYLLKK